MSVVKVMVIVVVMGEDTVQVVSRAEPVPVAASLVALYLGTVTGAVAATRHQPRPPRAYFNVPTCGEVSQLIPTGVWGRATGGAAASLGRSHTDDTQHYTLHSSSLPRLLIL